jgi:hypothetical protein
MDDVHSAFDEVGIAQNKGMGKLMHVKIVRNAGHSSIPGGNSDNPRKPQ